MVGSWSTCPMRRGCHPLFSHLQLMCVPEQNATSSSAGTFLNPSGMVRREESEEEEASEDFHRVKDPETPPTPFCLRPFRGFFPFQSTTPPPTSLSPTPSLQHCQDPPPNHSTPLGSGSSSAPLPFPHIHKFSQPCKPPGQCIPVTSPSAWQGWPHH